MLRDKEDRVRNLEDVVATQSITVEDVAELEAEHAQQTKKIDDVARVGRGHNERALQAQADLQKSFVKLEALPCAGFNSKVGNLGPLMDKYGRKRRTIIELDVGRAGEEKQDGMLGGV